MARSSLLDGFAYGVLNEIIATFREQDGGYSRPARYEVIIGPPKTQTTAKTKNKTKLRKTQKNKTTAKPPK